MRRAFLAFLSFAALAAATLAFPSSARADVEVSAGISVGAPVEVATFHERLAPYGHWRVVPTYGEVWAPDGLRADWRPYSDGRWVLTEYGWTFVSDDPWGWAAWHYGNWVRADEHGWVWIPDRVWAPAWVSWRHGGGYAAWAPAPPLRFRMRVYEVNSPAWVVVEERHFTQPIATVVIRGSVGATYIARTRPLAEPIRSGAIMVNPGPRPSRISAAVGRPIESVSARAVVGRGTAAIATAPRAPASPPEVRQALQRRWKERPSSAERVPAAAADHAARANGRDTRGEQRGQGQPRARGADDRSGRPATEAGPRPKRARRERRD